MKFARALLERRQEKLRRILARNTRGGGNDGLLRAFGRKRKAPQAPVTESSASVVPSSDKFGRPLSVNSTSSGSTPQPAHVPAGAMHRNALSAPAAPATAAPPTPARDRTLSGDEGLPAARDTSSSMTQETQQQGTAVKHTRFATDGHIDFSVAPPGLSRKQAKWLARLATDSVYAQRKAAGLATRRIQKTIARLNSLRDVQLVSFVCLLGYSPHFSHVCSPRSKLAPSTT